MQNRRIRMDAKSAKRFNRRKFLKTNFSVYESNLISISEYENLNYRFSVDDYFGNRAHTNLTNLNSELRPFLDVQGDKLGQIDISNSQPLFFYLLIKNVPKISADEKERYKSLVANGEFYEFFMRHFEIPENKRNESKQNILTGLFSDLNRPSVSRYFDYFEQNFPQIANYIKKIKTSDIGIDYNKNKYYKNLICLMQRKESKFVIETVVGEFIKKYEGEFISTIHDSIVIRTEMLPAAEQLMIECFAGKGIKPKLKTSLFFNEKKNSNKYRNEEEK